MHSLRLWWLLVAALSYGGFAQTSAADSDQSAFKSLFNGRDLNGWHTWLGASEVPRFPLKLWGDWPPQIGLNNDPDSVFSVIEVDGQAAIRISGGTWGALVSDQVFSNYHLQLQYKWGELRFAPRAEKPRNTGLLYHSVGDYGAFWTYWMRSAEFEIMQGHTGDFTSVDGVTGTTSAIWDWSFPFPWRRYAASGSATAVGGLNFRIFAGEDVERPKGVWNTIDLYVVADGALHVVNGKTVLSLENLRDGNLDPPQPLTSGRLQLQSEGAEVFFRNIRIRPLADLPTGAPTIAPTITTKQTTGER